jgi:hypothetical protein
MTVLSGNYTDILDLDDTGEMLVMPHVHCCVTLTEQKTHRSLAIIVGCRNEEKK